MNEQSCKYRFEVSVDCDKAYVVNKMDHWCWQKQSNWYSGPILWIAMGYFCDWTNDAKSLLCFSFLNISQNR